MATAANVSVVIALTGDLNARQEFEAAANAASPATDVLVTFPIGYTALTPPTGGSTPKRLTVLMPAANVATLTLKGVTGDTGIVLHPTDFASIPLNSPTTVVGFTASAEIIGVRLIWT
jgi:hypothetical protein